MKNIITAILFTTLLLAGCGANQITYFPFEEEQHEGTWLIWPHHYTYGKEYRDQIEPIWIEMTQALHQSENVHIIAYNQQEQDRITKRLTNTGIDMNTIDFLIAKSDDVWIRDTGPIFVKDQEGKLKIANFRFDGWGEKVPYGNDNKIPNAIADGKGFPMINIQDFILEGGSFELSPDGTAMLCKSSVISENRNPKLSQGEAETYLTKYLGITNFIWLEGVMFEDITDAHIDGIARFFDENTILTVDEDDFFNLYEKIEAKDWDTLLTAKNKAGNPFEIITLPLTQNNARGTDYKGNYLNFYAANEIVLLPVYDDPNDKTAIGILQKLYKDKEVVPINVTELYQYGGMLHCITQQQPQAEGN